MILFMIQSGRFANFRYAAASRRLSPPQKRPGILTLMSLLTVLNLPGGHTLTAAELPGNPANRNAFGAGVTLLGASLETGSVFLQYGLGTSLQAEAGAGTRALYGGLILYPLPARRLEGFSPYMGLLAGYSANERNRYRKDAYMYMPVGVRYVRYDHWFISAEIAATTADNLKWGPLVAGIKLGFLFTGR